MEQFNKPREFYTFIPPSITLLISLFLILIVFFVCLISNLSFSENKQKMALWSVQKNFGYQRSMAPAISMIDSAKVQDFAKSIERLFGNDGIVQTNSSGDKITLIVNKDFFYYADEGEVRSQSSAVTEQFLDIIKKWHNAEKPKFTIAVSGTNYVLDQKRLQFFKDNLPGINPDVGVNIDRKNHFVMIVDR